MEFNQEPRERQERLRYQSVSPWSTCNSRMILGCSYGALEDADVVVLSLALKVFISCSHSNFNLKKLPLVAPLLVVFIHKLLNLTEIKVAWNRVFLCSRIVILNQVQSVVI